MCELCNGTHVSQLPGIYTAFVRTCPECGPKSAEQLAEEREVRLRRLAEAKAKFNLLPV